MWTWQREGKPELRGRDQWEVVRGVSDCLAWGGTEQGECLGRGCVRLQTASVTWPWEIQQWQEVPLGSSGESPGWGGHISESPAFSDY